MLIADVDDRAAGWIYIALHDLRRRMTYNGKRPPAGVEEFAEWCRERASEGQSGSVMADLDGLADAVVMTRAALTLTETAATLNVSLSGVKRLVAAGELATVNIAGCVRVRVSDLDEYLAQRPTIERSA